MGQDIDRTAAMMCYIQLSLLGCAGYIVIANTLIHPVTGPLLWPNLTEHQDAWFMPMNFLDSAWVLRLSRTWRGLESEEKTGYYEKATATQDVVKTEPSKGAAIQPETAAKKQQRSELTVRDTESGQLTLF